MKITIQKSKKLTIQGAWLKLEETPEPIFIPIQYSRTVHTGESLVLTFTFDELIDKFGTLDEEEDG